MDHEELVRGTLATARLAGDVLGVHVLSRYTNLVLGCRRLESGGSEPSDLVIKFWRNELKQPLDVFAHEVARLGAPVPAIVATGHVPVPRGGQMTPRFQVQAGEPVAFTVYSGLPGRPAHFLAPGWTPQVRREACRQAGQWLARIHAARSFERGGPLERFPNGWQGTAADWYDYFAEQLHRWDRELHEHAVPRPHRRLRRSVRSWLGHRLPILSAVDRFVLCHRDFSFRNVLAHPRGGLVGVIDFEHALAGDPVFDWHRIAAWLLCHRREPPSWRAFLTGYRETAADRGMAAAREDEHQQLERLWMYLGFYGLSAMGYALREGDTVFYGQGLELLGWLDRHVC